MHKGYHYRGKGKPKFGGWKPEEMHEHDLETVTKPAGSGKTIIIDKCKTCPYEAARDLI